MIKENDGEIRREEGNDEKGQMDMGKELEGEKLR